MNKEQLKEFLKALADKFALAQTSLVVYKAIEEKSQTNPDVLNDAPAFFSITQHALATEIIVSLSALFERSKEGKGADRSLWKYLDEAKTCYGKEIFIKGDNLTIRISEIILNQLKSIEENQSLLLSVKSHRDQVRAHYDKKYFGNTEKQDQLPFLSFSDIEKLLNASQSIINFHWRYLFNSDMNNIPVNCDDIKMIFLWLERKKRWIQDADVCQILDEKNLFHP